MNAFHSADWIYLHRDVEHEKRSVLFRRVFWAKEMEESAVIHISADSRFKLYVNGAFVCAGPVPGNRFTTYYSSVDIAPFLTTGENAISVHVLKFPFDSDGATRFETGPIWLQSTSKGGLWLDGGDALPGIGTNEEWRVMDDLSYTFVPAQESKYAGDQEYVDGAKLPCGWKTAGFDDSAWQRAVVVGPATGFKLGGVLNNWQLRKTKLPGQFMQPLAFRRISRADGRHDFSGLLQGRAVYVPAGTHAWVELDMGEVVTAYLRFSAMGEGRVSLSYSESYYQKNDDWSLYKKRRSDSTGVFHGETDGYSVTSCGQEYEPYFYRTFRFLRIDVAAGERDVELGSFELFMTGYPLEVQGTFHCPDENINWLWEVSVRTLRRCMHESYIDCPYYERMQYVMDTLLQSLVSFQLSTDSRLAQKAIEDFTASQRPDGLLNCNAPAGFHQIIPGFSLLFIETVHYYYTYTGDIVFLESCLPVVDKILNYFTAKIDAKTGLVTGCGYWEFVDWVDAWQADFGTPMHAGDTVNIIYNMMFAHGLKRSAEMYEALDCADVAKRRSARRNEIIRAVNAAGYDRAAGLYRATPADERFSQHAQIWAVLSGCITGGDAQRLMRRCVEDESLLQVSFSMTFFLFRALEATGLYERSAAVWDGWLAMRAMDITTWPEDLVTQRSDCHGWGSIPVYELLGATLGLRPLAPGWKGVRVKPSSHGLGPLQGAVPTPYGLVCAKRRRAENGAWLYELKLPCEMEVEFEMEGICSRQKEGNTYTVQYQPTGFERGERNAD